MSKLEQLHQLAKALGKPESLAEMFCDLDDDAQAQFFVHVASIMKTWPRNVWGVPGAEWQANAIGKHLRACTCSTEDARELVRTIHDAMVSP